MPIAKKQRGLLTTEAEQEARWAEKFSKFLNRPSPTIEAEVQNPDTDQDVSTAPLEKDEVMAAIRSFKDEKPQNSRASKQNSSRQSQGLQRKLFGHSLQQYGRRKNLLTTGWKVPS